MSPKDELKSPTAAVTRLEMMRDLSRPSLHPDGTRAVVSVSHPNLVANRYLAQLWNVPLVGGEPSLLTRGCRDSSPRFSQNGDLLAFLRSDDGGSPQLCVIAANGGDPTVLSEAPLGVSEFAWSPDGAAIAFVARVPEAGRYGSDGGEAEAEAARMVTDVRYLEDGLGYGHDRPLQVFVVAVPDPRTEAVECAAPQAEQITHHWADSRAVAWSPDGSRLAFVSSRHEGRLTDMFCDVWTCAPDGSDLRQVTETSLSAESVGWSLDGESIWFLANDPGEDGLDYVARHAGLFSVDASGGTAPTRHTPAENIDLGEGGSMLTVLRDEVLVQNRRRGAVELLSIRPNADPEPIIDGPVGVSSYDAIGSGSERIVVASVTSADSPAELVLVRGGVKTQLTDFAAEVRTAFTTLPLHEFTVDAADGYPVHGWVVLPEGPGPHPVLLSIHGGPFSQHGWRYSGEIQDLATAGYAVVLVNPRGSAGYGQKHGSSIVGGLGVLDASDLLNFFDGMLAKPELPLDPDRVGVMGGSYGGFMTAWIIGQPETADRFAAAIVERGFLDPEAFADLSDIGWFYIDALVGREPAERRAQSPMEFAKNVQIPTFVIHSERDYRCPLEQGQRYFAKLKRNGVDTQMLIFPGESHGLTVFGQPRHRQQRIEAILAWWAKHLPTPQNPAAEV